METDARWSDTNARNELIRADGGRRGTSRRDDKSRDAGISRVYTVMGTIRGVRIVARYQPVALFRFDFSKNSPSRT